MCKLTVELILMLFCSRESTQSLYAFANCSMIGGFYVEAQPYTVYGCFFPMRIMWLWMCPCQSPYLERVRDCGPSFVFVWNPRIRTI